MERLGPITRKRQKIGEIKCEPNQMMTKLKGSRKLTLRAERDGQSVENGWTDGRTDERTDGLTKPIRKNQEVNGSESLVST